jgi:hypothetical protein
MFYEKRKVQKIGVETECLIVYNIKKQRSPQLQLKVARILSKKAAAQIQVGGLYAAGCYT